MSLLADTVSVFNGYGIVNNQVDGGARGTMLSLEYGDRRKLLQKEYSKPEDYATRFFVNLTN